MRAESSIDPRAWNLAFGAMLLAGCANRPVPQEPGGTEDESDGDGDSTSTSESTSETGETPECVVDEDCGGPFVCTDGVCEYIGYQDTWSDYDCIDTYDCGPFEMCVDGYCVGVSPPPPPACPAQDLPPTLIQAPGDGEPLALAFVDVDDDGSDELVVAVTGEVRVYEDGVFSPIASQPWPALDAVDTIVAGDFDATPGQDIVVLADGTSSMYASDGVAGFDDATPIDIGHTEIIGLLAANFDSQFPTDLVAWGSWGAAVEFGDQTIEMAWGHVIQGAAALDDDISGGPRVVLRRVGQLDFRSLAGNTIGSGDVPQGLKGAAHAGFVVGGQGYLAAASVGTEWSLVQAWLPWAVQEAEWTLVGEVSDVHGGDLDGDGDDELVYQVASGPVIHLDPLDDGGCLLSPTFVGHGALLDTDLGDFDGDGDDELVMRFEFGAVMLLDAE